MDATVHSRQLAPDSSKVTTVTGASAEPASAGLSPATISRAGMNTNAKPPRAPLTTKVTALAARNRAGRKIAGGSTGWLPRHSVTAKAAEDATASTAAAVNPGDLMPPPGRTMIA